MRLLLRHTSSYKYPEPASLGPHLIRLRPASHVRAKVETYALRIAQEPDVRWQQDPAGNHVARVSFRAGVRVPRFDVEVEMVVDVQPVNPFDFFVDDTAERLPFAYRDDLAKELAPYLDKDDPAYAIGPRFAALLETLPTAGPTVPALVEMNRKVHEATRYVIREEAGVWTPERTLEEGRGSCRDSAVLLIAALRARGVAARFASGYLVQLTDEGMIPDAPRGVSRDVVDLHAWAEAYVPGAGWVGLDATSGLLCGEGHIALVCTASPSMAAPIDGTSDVVAEEVSFGVTLGRLGHEPRPTAPYEEATWQRVEATGQAIDQLLRDAGVVLTVGGEPTFNARDATALPEWNGEALGADKWDKALRLAGELRRRLAPGAAVLLGQGKHYPGESLPRWALEICARRDGVPVWTGDFGVPAAVPGDGVESARALAGAIARELGLGSLQTTYVQSAYEDPWRYLQDEASLPVEVDPLAADLDDPEERRRLARVLDRGLGREAGFVMPLTRDSGTWESEVWQLRRGRVYLLPGDGPLGLRLPLASLPWAWSPPPYEEPWPDDTPPDPRRGDDARAQAAQVVRAANGAPARVRTALCVEARASGSRLALHVFLPPLRTTRDFFDLVAAVDRARRSLDLGEVILEGYPPPKSPELFRFAITPDPGVIEVNVPPSSTSAEHQALLGAVFDAALHAGLHSEKYMLDGRLAGSGGGHHVTLGGPTPRASVFLQRPDVLASLLTLIQHHPSLSYLFTGLFVGPTSQAPRVDEARHDALYELEIALARAFETPIGSAPPWLSDALFRHLLVDLSGNTHRTEVCIDKLFDPQTAYGRQGLVELRAFEMPPHPRMAVTQVLLARALVAAVIREPYRAPLVRWGQGLHDRFLLPYWIWRDFEDVLAELARRGIELPAEAFRPFLELRCPVVGALQAGDVRVEIRNAIEPWHVLGEELTQSGTSRYVDSSMERIEVRAENVVPERHALLVNGHLLPTKPTRTAGERVAGVRFRAWAPPHALHPHLGIHHPVRVDVVDLWARRSLGACAYHVWHPEGRAYDTPPLTRFEASARRAQRFTIEGPLGWPIAAALATPHDDAPYTLDLRRLPIDRPMPEPEEETSP